MFKTLQFRSRVTVYDPAKFIFDLLTPKTQLHVLEPRIKLCGNLTVLAGIAVEFVTPTDRDANSLTALPRPQPKAA